MSNIPPAKKFTRTPEDFACGHCGHQIQGTGYTNHCPKCLWSRHVDINPGDRLAKCGGLMEPIGVEVNQAEYTVIHRCQVCGHQKRNKTAKDDDFQAILALAKSAQP